MTDITQVKYRPRVVDCEVERYLEAFGAVCIEGPKWCGKTMTASMHCNSSFFVGDPSNNFQNRQLAELSPDLVLQGDTPRLLDEWQEVAALWDAVRFTVDSRAAKGQFVLTGSSTPIRKGILHSGAGRIGRLRMRTMSLWESGDSCGAVSLRQLCDGEFQSVMTGDVKLYRLAELIVRGGWPGNLDVSISNASLTAQSYIDALIDDDAYRLDDVKYDKNKIRLLLQSLARNESTTVSNSNIARDISANGGSVDPDTVASYLDLFERLFLLDNQPPFSGNLRSATRLKQSPKRHFCDPALAAALLKASPERLVGDLTTFGFLFEALCERDLRVYAESFGARVCHYQDYRQREVDAVVELSDGRWCAFEIKLGFNQVEEAAAQLVALRDSIAREGGTPPTQLCVICGLANAAFRRSDGVFVVPVTALKP